MLGCYTPAIMPECGIGTAPSVLDLKSLWSEQAANQKLNFDHLDPLNKVRQRRVGKYNVYFNPGRAAYMADKIRNAIYVDYEKEHNPVEDTFCINKADILQRHKLGEVVLENDAWDIIANNSPITTYHSLLIPVNDIDRQHLKPAYVEDLALFSKMCSDMTLTFNSAGAGASQNHFHSHIFYTPLPVTEQSTVETAIDEGVKIGKPGDYPIVTLVFESDDTKAVAESVMKHVRSLMVRKIPYNATMINGRFYLIPRSKEGEDGFPSRGFDTVAGSFPVLDQADFDNFNEMRGDNILREIGYTQIEIAGRDYQN